MQAAARDLAALMSSGGQRFIIPVYQRPYTWQEKDCNQLWDDILDVGRRDGGKHFTGSVVWVQQGIMSPSGITPVLIIDGQQRITTMSLLFIALAEYARDHESAQLPFSCEKILNTYLVNQYECGEEHYRLTLSQGDRDVFRGLVQQLEDPESSFVAPESSRLVQNLESFRKHVSEESNLALVWLGILRLEIVSISLDQGKDNPQLIFESMNATGEPLSTADLIRNYVLMGLPADEQERLYTNHWRKIEEMLGTDTYDQVFDDFIRNWLTVCYAPNTLVKRNMYTLFKRHVADNGYDTDGRIVDLLSELERYAGYYAHITRGTETDFELNQRLGRLASLGFSVVNPLLLLLYNDYEHGAFSHGDFVSMLDTLESYLFRRAICGCATNSLNNFFLRVIGKLKQVQAGDESYREVFEALLLTEAGTPRRFPSDAEFTEALQTRDTYNRRRYCLYLLSRLENSYHPKDERDFSTDTYTIEHIMPQNAMAHEEWRTMLGEDCDEKHEQLVHTLGNLTLTAYNSELSDATFAEKKERAVGGYDNEFISISADLREADTWGEEQIRDRGNKLAQRALEVWPTPELSTKNAELTAKLSAAEQLEPAEEKAASSEGKKNGWTLPEYWAGFYRWCFNDLPEFVRAFPNVRNREPTWNNEAVFSQGLASGRLIIVAQYPNKPNKRIRLRYDCEDLNAYSKIQAHSADFEALAEELVAELHIDPVENAVAIDARWQMKQKKSRSVIITRSADFDTDDWDELYAWQAKGLLGMREIVLDALDLPRHWSRS